MSVYKDEPETQVTKQSPENPAVYITKSNGQENLVFGWANIALKADGTIPLDWQNDATMPEVLEKAAYQFVLKSRETGEMHEGEAKGYLVESIMFTKEKMEALNIPEGVVPEGWWIGFYIPDDAIFKKVQSGQYKMFSIEGRARRVPMEGGQDDD